MTPPPPPKMTVGTTAVQRILWCGAQVPDIWECCWKTTINLCDLPRLSCHLSRQPASSELSTWRHKDKAPFIQTWTSWKGHSSFRGPRPWLRLSLGLHQSLFSPCPHLLPFPPFHSCYPQEHFLINPLHTNLHLRVYFLQFFLLIV